MISFGSHLAEASLQADPRRAQGKVKISIVNSLCPSIIKKVSARSASLPMN
jgi:hypothetical protein